MGDGFLSEPSPWLINFEGGPIAEKLRVPSVQDQIDNDKKELGLKKASLDLMTTSAASVSINPLTYYVSVQAYNAANC